MDVVLLLLPLTPFDGELAFTLELPLEAEVETRDLDEVAGFELEVLALVCGLAVLRLA